MAPESGERRPKIVSSNSDRPDPTRPKIPTTSPGATVRSIFRKFGESESRLVFNASAFAVFPVARGKAGSVSFKCDPERFLELTDVPGIIPAPYLARAHWVQVTDAKALPDAQARELVAHSHALILAKLTKRERDAIAAAPAKKSSR